MKPATLLLALANVLVFLVSGPATEGNGFNPAHPSVQSAASSMFVHADLAHLLGNMGFLLVFGTLVERELGSVRFLVLYMAAGLAGAGMYLVVDPTSTNPLVGASGAVFGVLAACAMLRPQTLVFVGVYFACNLIGLVFPDAVGMHDVAVGAHVGGFVVGYAMTRVVFAGKLEEA